MKLIVTKHTHMMKTWKSFNAHVESDKTHLDLEFCLLKIKTHFQVWNVSWYFKTHCNTLNCIFKLEVSFWIEKHGEWSWTHGGLFHGDETQYVDFSTLHSIIPRLKNPHPNPPQIFGIFSLKVWLEARIYWVGSFSSWCRSLIPFWVVQMKTHFHIFDEFSKDFLEMEFPNLKETIV